MGRHHRKRACNQALYNADKSFTAIVHAETNQQPSASCFMINGKSFYGMPKGILTCPVTLNLRCNQEFSKAWRREVPLPFPFLVHLFKINSSQAKELYNKDSATEQKVMTLLCTAQYGGVHGLFQTTAFLHGEEVQGTILNWCASRGCLYFKHIYKYQQPTRTRWHLSKTSKGTQKGALGTSFFLVLIPFLQLTNCRMDG